MRRDSTGPLILAIVGLMCSLLAIELVLTKPRASTADIQTTNTTTEAQP